MTVATLDAVDKGIPRRLSARPGDRFFDPGMVARLDERIAVMLDGRELADVASWDVDKGEIVRILRRYDGTATLDESGAAATETRRDRVEVRWTGEGPSPLSSGERA